MSRSVQAPGYSCVRAGAAHLGSLWLHALVWGALEPHASQFYAMFCANISLEKVAYCAQLPATPSYQLKATLSQALLEQAHQRRPRSPLRNKATGTPNHRASRLSSLAGQDALASKLTLSFSAKHKRRGECALWLQSASSAVLPCTYRGILVQCWDTDWR